MKGTGKGGRDPDRTWVAKCLSLGLSDQKEWSYANERSSLALARSCISGSSEPAVRVTVSTTEQEQHELFVSGGPKTYRARGLGVAEKDCLLAFHPDDAGSLELYRGEVGRTGTDGGAQGEHTHCKAGGDSRRDRWSERAPPLRSVHRTLRAYAGWPAHVDSAHVLCTGVTPWRGKAARWAHGTC